MTEKEKEELRELKCRKVEELQQLVKKRSKKLTEVWETDNRLKPYIMKVAKEPEKHNLWEICAIVRFYDMLNRYKWHKVRARLVIHILETLKYQTDDGLMRIRLQPVQVFMVSVPFGLVKEVKEANEKKLRRVIRDIIWMVPRKFGKTTLIAGLAVVEFFFGPRNAEVDVVSTTGKQAKICYNMIKTAMMDLVRTTTSLQRVKLKYNREMISYENPLDGAQSVNVFGDNPDALNGYKPSMAIEDESAAMDDKPSKAGNESRNTLESGQGPRKEPLSFQITTASKYVNGPFAQSLKGIKEVLAGNSKNDQLFAMLFCPDVDDREDDPATWDKCHPMLGETVQADYYEKEWQKAKDNATYLNEFRTKQLNVFAVPETKAWISAETVAKLMIKWEPLDMPVLRENPKAPKWRAMIGLDLAQKWDFTAVSIAIFRKDLNQMWVHTKYFLPDGVRVWVEPKEEGQPNMAATPTDGTDGGGRTAAYEEGDTYWKEDELYVYRQEMAYDGQIHSGHPNKKLYHRWIEDGQMVLTHGTIVDYDVVARYIYELAQRFPVEKIGYDDYKWQDFASKLARMGGSEGLVAFGQTYGDFTPPTKAFELGVERGTILLAESDVTKWCFQNAILDEDPRGNVKPVKSGEYNRIDGVVTSIMACGLMFDVGTTRHSKNNFEK